ncbi:MAG: CocE/NonD family hydrolase [Planctomycetota bacterium]
MGKAFASQSPLPFALAVCIFFAGGCSRTHAGDAEAVSVEKDVKIPMRDGVNLLASIYKPKKMPRPLPVLFLLTPYGADFQVRRGHWYAQRGYVIATIDVRGCGHSEGTFKPFENEGRDGHDVVEWLALQPWCNGKVGMFGWSYLGWCQWSTIKECPPHLETIVPGVSTYPGTAGIPKNRNIFLPYVMSWLNDVARCSGRPSPGLDDYLYWQERLANREASGLSIDAFC